MNPFSLSVKELEQKARAIRRRIIVLNAESPAGGHTGADLSQVELLTALYFRILNCSPALEKSDERDIYIQSKGHAVGGYYCVLAEAGFIPLDWLATYQHADSHLPGHPVKHKTPGIELNTGALGHGLPVAVGIALAAKRDNNPVAYLSSPAMANWRRAATGRPRWSPPTTSWITLLLSTTKIICSWPVRPKRS